MGMPSCSSILISCTCIILFSLCLHVVDGGGDRHHDAVNISSLLPGDACSTPQAASSGRGLKVVPRYGPCSSLASTSLQKEKEELQILHHDQSRVSWLHLRHRRRRNPSPSSSIPAHTGDSLNTGNYFVTVGFGTPTRELSTIFDTGSDVTWIQCQPCVSYCYPQEEPLFDPSQSSTYSNISCSSSSCSQLGGASTCSGSTCIYGVQYGDNSYTVGFYAQDTLTLSSTGDDVLPAFHFGCGEKNRGLFGKAAGLLGLGRGKASLVSQSISKYGGVFSYCLPSTSSSTGYLSFGASTAAAHHEFTPMLTDPSNPTFYFLNLVGITVGGHMLPVASTVFTTPGTIIDSGTVITRLPPTAYSALRDAFSKAMAKYPSAPALSILDTCYDFSGYSSVMVPTVGLVFGGGRGLTVGLSSSGILYTGSISQVCLAFAGNGDDSDLGIIGNVQQRTLGVVYDVSKKVVGFAPASCT